MANLDTLADLQDDEIRQNSGEFDQDTLADLEAKRKSVTSKLLELKILFAVLACAFIFLIFISTGDFGMGFFGGAFVAIFGYGFFSGRVVGAFESEFKDKVISHIIADISPNLVYEKKKFIEFDEFNAPKIYNSFYEIFKGNDLIYGVYDGVEIKFSDIYLGKLVRDPSHPNKPPRQEKIFQGIAFIADFNKNFTAKVIVLDKKNSRTSCNLKKTKMDNSEFNDVFNTHCDDEIAARYILTPNLMEKLLNMRKFFGVSCDFCFIENKIYAYINLGRDSFEANLKIPLTGENSAPLHHKKEIMQFIDIIENLKLNSKIFKPNFGSKAGQSENDK